MSDFSCPVSPAGGRTALRLFPIRCDNHIRLRRTVNSYALKCLSGCHVYVITVSAESPEICPPTSHTLCIDMNERYGWPTHDPVAVELLICKNEYADLISGAILNMTLNFSGAWGGCLHRSVLLLLLRPVWPPAHQLTRLHINLFTGKGLLSSSP
jgi:hypothetical protein